MIPLTIADDVQATLLDYLTTTFNFQDEQLERSLVDFLSQAPGGMFQGPYLQLQLPFRKSSPDETAAVPLTIKPAFTPYRHQSRAWSRLSSQEQTPQPTLVTTGTGSGKTEAFLYPILDHCYRHQAESGIKAIILYPMNALATDQAGRLAQTIWQDERLRGRVTAGLYIGGQGETSHAQMGETHLIDDRAALRRRPPDILLTNYRMLDFLLLRPEDRSLWAGNAPTSLRYLVLDELHTYDGAQGSDVACLIRRLQARLQTPPGFLCPVGTSATMSSEDENDAEAAPYHALTAFAAQLFNQPFPAAAVIGEERLTLAEFLPDAPTHFHIPTASDDLAAWPGETPAAYCARQIGLWLAGTEPDPVRLGEALSGHHFLRLLLAELDGDALAQADLCQRLARVEPDFAAAPPAQQRRLLHSFLALVAYARRQVDGRQEPFLPLQAQLWVREMSRLLRQVGPQPAFVWEDEAAQSGDGRQQHGLPAYFCRECGHSGWLTHKHDGDDRFGDEYGRIIRAYFDRHKNVCYLYPGQAADRLPHLQDRLCPACLSLSTRPDCPHCDAATIPIIVHRATSQPAGQGQPRDRQQCPICGTEGALGILGRQAASLLSVAISLLYTSPLNQEKKLLAFTDSVQDASHRAAFFGARTFRFSLRTALQTTLSAQPPTTAGPYGLPAVPLTRLADLTLAHWRQRWQAERGRGPADQRLAATFMPPDLRDLAAYRHYIEGPAAPLPANLVQMLKRRLSWEVTMEYGFNARIGRSLEKVGSSTALLAEEQVAAATTRLGLLLRNEFGLLRDLTAEQVRHFLVGLLERTRLRGGVAHPLLHPYAADQGNWYLLTKKVQPLLSPFAKRSPRFPRFLTDSAVRDVFDLFQSRNPGTWTADWARRALSADLGLPDINDLYRLVVPALAEVGLLEAYARGQATAYGLQPDALWITVETAVVRCDDCGQRQTVTPPTVSHWQGRACLNFRCAGHYQPLSETAVGSDYYRQLYEQGQVERIFSAEHTGLLDRETRERVERGFRSQQQADAPNLLTATPTLEMGIDIGDLSATVACSVPPTTANYLQRIGRAGRKTGNAFVMTMAITKPHDLYYFDDPPQMIAGTISPPGCFLDAPNMLQRQFLAFTIDTWTAVTPEVTQLPRNVKEMLAGLKREAFPLGMLRYYEAHKAQLIEAFLDLFGTDVSPANQAWLRTYAAGDGLVQAVKTAVTQIAAVRQQWRDQYRTLRAEEQRIDENRARYDDPDEELAQIDQEMKLLVAQIKTLEEKYILNFFTDAGLLPNYAFPETGVKLNAIITGIEADGAGGKRYQAHEYIRPAPLAIRELVPFNTFYAQGHKLKVSGVDVREKDTVIERWQFCDRCTYMTPVVSSHYSSSCPRCGSTLWHDTGQQHDMLRLRATSARTDYQQSLSRDDTEEREREYYQIGLYFEADREQSQGAYLLPGLPFGLEHLNEVILREINFGLRDNWGQKVVIAGEERPDSGFQVCPDCGVVLDPRQTEESSPTRHAHTCAAARRSRQKKTGPLTRSSIDWHNLYLYRTITSEALRLLLPVSTVLVEEKMATFRACLDLGLRLWFRGDPIHLDIAPMVELSLDGTRRRFLIIYDAVPGGTGYLRDLAQPDAFRSLLQMTLARLTSCDCRREAHKQACYRCLYSYRTQYQKELISRQMGVELLQEVLAEWPELTNIASLSEADMVSLIESELEQRFVDAMSEYASHQPDARWQMRLRDGKSCWQFSLGQQSWLLEPQVVLGPEERVSVTCRPDFVLWPLSDEPGIRPVAVFTDGFAYHALPNQPHGRLGDDMHKRHALLASGSFYVWSLTWDDVAEFAEATAFPLSLLENNQQAQLGSFLKKQRSPLSNQLLKENGVRQLLRYLRQPQMAAWTTLAGMLALVHMVPPRPPVATAVMTDLTTALRQQEARPNLTLSPTPPAGSALYGIREEGAISLLVHAAQTALQGQALDEMVVTLRLEDTAVTRSAQGFRQEWRSFLLLANLFQFLPQFTTVTTEGIGQFGVTAAFVVETALFEPEPTADAAAWDDAFDYAAPACEPLLRRCQQAGLPPPTVGYALLGRQNKVVAEAELGWEEEKTAVFLPNQTEDQQRFAAAGWQVFAAADSEALLAQLQRLTET